MTFSNTACDICLICEGTYPYVSGGVSTWIHDLINYHTELTFHIVALSPPKSTNKLCYTIPSNVCGITHIYLQELADENPPLPQSQRKKVALELLKEIIKIPTEPSLETLRSISRILKAQPKMPGKTTLLNSFESFQYLIKGMYEALLPNSGYLDYFWSWRALFGGLFSIMTTELPEAKIYHALCTGYAGIALAKAKIDTGKPCLLTEHGIYTNERRIEIASAEWLQDVTDHDLTTDENIQNYTLRGLWIDTFSGYSKICYQAADQIITLYKGNFALQIEDGAPPEKLLEIANGIDVKSFSSIGRDQQTKPTIAFIGRVVPIKDLTTFIFAISKLKTLINDFNVLVMGPDNEDKSYSAQCQQLIKYLSLENDIIFTGMVNIKDYLGKVDIVVLSSISEAQPLVILEAGANGIPTVATDVGSCRELIFGKEDETPKLGAGGDICRLVHPDDMAHALHRLLTDKEHYKRCSASIKQRVESYYNLKKQHDAYSNLYNHYLTLAEQ